MSRSRRHFFRTLLRGPLFLALLASPLAGCGDSLGPGVAVALTLTSIDGVSLPAAFNTPGGRLVAVGTGRLQGTNWGHACGVALALTEGPMTAAQVPDCRLEPGEERIFTITLTDSRFPAGAHQYRFVP